MKLLEIQINDFMSMANVSVTFEDGIISVIGRNNDVIGATSNGSGKSVLFDAIVWALYGKTIRPVGSDDVIRRGTDKASVQLYFQKNESTYGIARARSDKASLELNVSEETAEPVSLTQGTPSLTQVKLDEIIGMDYKTFLSVATFDLDALRFARATDKEQKEILERLLNFGLYNEALEKTRKELATKEKELVVAQSALGYLQNTQNQQIKELDTYQIQLAQYHKMIESESSIVTGKLVQIEGAITNCKGHIDAHNLKIQELRNAPITIDAEAIDAQKGIINLAELAVDAHELEIKQLQKDLAQDVYVDAIITKKYNESKTNLKLLDQHLKTIEINIKAKEAQIALIEKKIGVPCGECKRPITEGEVNSVLESYANEVLKLMEEKAGIELEYTQREIHDSNISQQYAEAYQKAIDAGQQKALINAKIGKHNNEISSRRVDIRAAEHKILVLQESARKTIQDEIVSAQTEMNRWTAQIPVYEKEILKIKHAFELLQAEESKYADKIDKVTAQMQTSVKEIKSKEAAVICITDDIAYLKYWEKAFGYQGIRAVLLDDVAAKLTETANNYLKEMMGGTLWIDCHTQSANKDGEKRERFEVQTFNSFGAGTYYGNSKGEQQRIDIALSLALHDIARTRSNSPIGFTIFDEVFERLDEAGCDSIIRLLHKERNAFGTVFVVSHNPNLTIRFPKSIEFVKQNGITSLVKKEEIKCEKLKPVLPQTEKTIPRGRPGRPKKNLAAKPQ